MNDVQDNIMTTVEGIAKDVSCTVAQTMFRKAGERLRQKPSFIRTLSRIFKNNRLLPETRRLVHLCMKKRLSWILNWILGLYGMYASIRHHLLRLLIILRLVWKKLSAMKELVSVQLGLNFDLDDLALPNCPDCHRPPCAIAYV